MNLRVTSSKVGRDRDISRVRNNARILAMELGFSTQDQTRIATAVSEITRNSIQYAGAAVVDFELTTAHNARLFQVVVKDNGPGIDNLDRILSGDYRSETGLGMGLAGSRRLMDTFDVSTGDEGTTVEMGKFLPGGSHGDLADLAHTAAEALQSRKDVDPVAELEHQNGELLYSLQELRTREDMLEKTNSELMKVTDELSKSLEQSRFLLQEVHHRVKNNLQIIGSLVSMHLRGAKHEETAQVLNSLGARVRAFGFIHDQLYKQGSDGQIELNEYLSAICVSLRNAIVSQDQNVQIDTDVERMSVEFEFAQDFGLIVNELVTNACKHAFEDTTRGRIVVRAHRDESRLVLEVSDNGVGFSEDEEPGVSGNSLGMMILHSTIRKLQGEIDVRGENGFTARISVPLPDSENRAAKANRSF